MKLKDIIGSLTAKFAALVLTFGLAGGAWAAETTTIKNAEGENITVYVVADGFYQSADTYGKSTDFYITSKAGLLYFRTLVNADDGGVIAGEYGQAFMPNQTAIQLYTNNIFNGKTVHLLTDVDLENEDWAPIGYVHYDFNNGESKTYFYGSFNGHNHVISNVKIVRLANNQSRPNQYWKNYGSYGFFGYMSPNSNPVFQDITIRNFTAICGENTLGSNEYAGDYLGCIVGDAGSYAVTFRNCHIVGDVSVSSSYVAGCIVGIGNVNVIDCSVEATGGTGIEASTFAGGLIGAERCSATSSLNITGNTVSGVEVTSYRAGSLVGAMALDAKGSCSVTGNDVVDCIVNGDAATVETLLGPTTATTVMTVENNTVRTTLIVETGDLTPAEEITPTTTEVNYTVPVTVKDRSGNVVSETTAQEIAVSVADADIANTTLASVKIDDVVAKAIESVGEDATSVTAIEIQVKASTAAEGEVQAITYEVHPEAVVTVSKTGEADATSTVELSNTDLAADAVFTFDLDVSSITGIAVGDKVRVTHSWEAYTDAAGNSVAAGSETTLAAVQANRMVRITTTHFTTWTLEGFENKNDTVAVVFAADGTSTQYTTLAAATAAAYDLSGDVNVQLIANVAESATICQKAGQNLTVNGDGNTLTGQLIVLGLRSASDATRTETLTIKNFNFTGADDKSDFTLGDAFVYFPNETTASTYKPSGYTGSDLVHAHNVTIADCSFSAAGNDNPSTANAVAIKSLSTGLDSIKLKNIDASYVHSIQFFSVQEAELDGVTLANTKNGINFNFESAGVATIRNSSICPVEAEAYGIRIQGAGHGVINLLEGTVISAYSAFETGNTSTTTISTDGTINVQAGSYKGLYTTSKGNYEIVVTGGIFENDPSAYVAEGYKATALAQTSAEYAAGYRYTIDPLPVVATVTANDVTTNYYDLHAALEAGKASGTTITLLTDVDLSGVNWVPVGTSASPFTGVFDGNGKTISNLSVNDEALTYAGLLGYVTGSTFKNITISNVTVNAAASIGSLMGYCNTSSVTNCHVQGRIQLSGHYKMGGILGEGYTNFTDCSVIGDGESTSSILATPLMKTDDPTKYEYEADNIGGMVGHWSEGTATIKNCTVKDISVTGYRKIGGMVAISFCSQKIEDVTVENVKVTCTAPKAYAEDNTSTTGMGGIVGQYHRQGGEYTGGWMKGATIKNVNLEATDSEALGIIKAGLVSSGLRDSAAAESPISKASMTFSDIVFEGENSIPEGVKTMNDAAFGPVYVAQIGTTKYETVEAALTDAQTSGATIEILTDSIETPDHALEVLMGGNITLTSTAPVRVEIAPTAKTSSVDTDGMAYIRSVSADARCTFTVGENVTLAFPATAAAAGAMYIGYSAEKAADMVINGRLELYEPYVGSLSTLTVNPSGSIKSISECLIVRWGATVDIVGTGAEWSDANPQAEFGYVELQGGVTRLKDTYAKGGAWVHLYNRNADKVDQYGATTLVLDNSVLATSKINNEAVIELDVDSQIVTPDVQNTGSINIDATGITQAAKIIDYTGSGTMALADYGTVNVTGGEAYVEDNDLWVKKLPVAQIGANKYETLAEAIAAVPTDGTETTITMIANEAIDIAGNALVIAASMNVVLDLNGFQVVGFCSTGENSALILNNGTLTIVDSSDVNADGTGAGKLAYSASPAWNWSGVAGDYSGSYASNLISNNGTVSVESGLLEVINPAGKLISASFAIDSNSGGVVNIKGGKLTSSCCDVIRVRVNNSSQSALNISGGSVAAVSPSYRAIWVQDPSYNGNSTVNISGGLVSGPQISIQNDSSGSNAKATITGGTFDGFFFTYSELDISDGAFNGGKRNGTVFSVSAYGSKSHISGGVFYGFAEFYSRASTLDWSVTGGAFSYGGPYQYASYTSEAFVRGGIYDDEQRYIAPGFVLTGNTDPDTKVKYPYAVVPAVASITIDDKTTYYATFEDAIDDAELSGDEITIVVINYNADTMVAPEGWQFLTEENVTTLVKREVAQIVRNNAVFGPYSKLADAFAAAQAGDTITLLADCETGSQYTISNPLVLTAANVTLDLNGKTITATGNFSFLISGNNAIVKNGTIQAGANTAKTTGINSYAIVVNGCDGVKLSGLTVNGGVSVGGSTGGTPNAASATNVVIEDCTVTSGDFYAVCAQQNSTVTISSGSYTANTVSSNSGTLYASFVGTDGPKGTIYVTGGMFAGKIPSGNKAGDIVISGGVYSVAPDAKFCAVGYEVVDNTDSGTSASYPKMVAHVNTGYIVEDEDDEGYAVIPAVDPDWIKDNVTPAGATATTEEIEAALNTPDETTKLKKWEAYVLNQEEPIKIKSIESVGNDDKLTTTLGDAKTGTGLDVSYSLVKVNSATGAETDGTASASKTFTLEKANGSLETGLYKVRVHFKPTGDTSASEITVDSENTVGVLKTQPTGQFVVVPVPFKELGGDDAPVKVASYIRSGLANGDVLHVYNGSNYDSWTYNGTSWEKTTNMTVNDENTTSTSESAEPSDAALSRGTAAILRRATGNTAPLVFVGDYTGAAEQQITAGWNLVASPSLEPFDPSTEFKSGKIQIPGDGLPKNYTFKNGKWGYSGVVEVDAPNGNGKIKMPGRIEVETLPAGTGFWYFNDSQQPQQVEW